MPPLLRVIVGCHWLIVGALFLGLLQPVTTTRIVVAAALALPLVLTARGLAAAQRPTLQRLAVLLVAYIGGLSVEVVASSGSTYPLAVGLLAAVLELGLLLAFIRRTAHPLPITRE